MQMELWLGDTDRTSLSGYLRKLAKLGVEAIFRDKELCLPGRQACVFPCVFQQLVSSM